MANKKDRLLKKQEETRLRKQARLEKDARLRLVKAQKAILPKKEETGFYPRFVFKGEDKADQFFVAKVKEIVSKVDFEEFPDLIRSWYRSAKSYPKFIYEFLKEGEGNPLVLAYMCHMGEYIFQQLGADLRKWIPFNDIRVVPIGETIEIHFNSLKQERPDGSIVYFSSAEPKLTFGKTDYVIGFSSHVIERVLERIIANPYSYVGAGDAFAFFNNCQYFEKVSLSNGQTAFSFFDQCACGFNSWNYVIACVKNIKEDVYYARRVGYCPIAFTGRFAKAKTLLPPGYDCTPEEVHLKKLHKSRQEQFLKIIETHIGSLVERGNCFVRLPENYYEPTKYFHQFVPQVIESEKPLYSAMI
jgi:hypothetical protein